MKTTAVRFAAVPALLALFGCSETDNKPVKAAPPPKKEEPIKKHDLLTEPAEDVILSKQTAKIFPELKIKTLKEGEGEDVLEYGKIGALHLKGELSSGKEFKNTRGLGGPEEILMMECGDVPGLILGAVGMKKGEIRQLTIPSDLAYGKRGDPISGVQPNATVFMRVELVEIKDTLEPGFMIRRMKAGTGDPIRVGQNGRFNYSGILAEGDRAGEQFDSSRKPTGDTPFTTVVGPMGQVIAGWQKGLVGMRVGEQRWLKIPAKLAYGEMGQGDTIPPNSTLIFEVELMAIEG